MVQADSLGVLKNSYQHRSANAPHSADTTDAIDERGLIVIRVRP